MMVVKNFKNIRYEIYHHDEGYTGKKACEFYKKLRNFKMKKQN